LAQDFKPNPTQSSSFLVPKSLRSRCGLTSPFGSLEIKLHKAAFGDQSSQPDNGQTVKKLLHPFETIKSSLQEITIVGLVTTDLAKNTIEAMTLKIIWVEAIG